MNLTVASRVLAPPVATLGRGLGGRVIADALALARNREREATGALVSRVRYLMIRVRRTPAAAGRVELAGVAEVLDTGSKQEFTTGRELLALIEASTRDDGNVGRAASGDKADDSAPPLRPDRKPDTDRGRQV